jgi:hypothetical protein
MGQSRCRLHLTYIGSTAVATMAALFPHLLTYGRFHWLALTRDEMSEVHPAFDLRLLLFGYRMDYVLGPLALLALSLILIRRWRCYREAPRHGEALMIFSATAFVPFTAQFLALPLDCAYLLCGIPFLPLLAEGC